MKGLLSILLMFFSIQIVSAQSTVKMTAVKSTDYGVAYKLPKTEIVMRASVSKKTRKTGEFYRYAEKYLNVSNPIIKDEVIYSLENVEVATRGIASADNSYLVEFKSNSVAPFVMLTKDGLICAINEEVSLPVNQLFVDKEYPKSKSVANPQSYLSEEILRAGSTAKQAELIAKQIYRLRESKTNILTGEADNMPPDGNAYKLVLGQIDEQEQALTSMFIGTETVEYQSQDFNVVPDLSNIEKRTVFRFSSKLGIVGASDLSGAPVALTLTNKEPRNEVELTPKEQKVWDDKFSKGIIYNVPAKADLTVSFNGKNLYNAVCDIVQYGTQDVLLPKQLEYRKDSPVKIIFYPELGAIKQIIQ